MRSGSSDFGADELVVDEDEDRAVGGGGWNVCGGCYKTIS